jgi:plastocyanin
MHGRTTSGRRWIIGIAVIAPLLTVTACGVVPYTGTPGPAAGAAGPSSDQQADPASNSDPATSSAASKDDAASKNDASADCTKATKVTILQKQADGKATYSFSPAEVKLQKGAFLAITNTSDQIHELASTPDAGIVTSFIDRKERQVIQFPELGTFTVQSAQAAHRAVLKVTVDGDSGCGQPKPSLTITDKNAFTPAKVTLTATENFAVVNKSGNIQTLQCDPDPGSNGDNSRLDPGETELLAVDKPGEYVCASVQHPTAAVTITVKKA